jgi:hypothetical protein
MNYSFINPSNTHIPSGSCNSIPQEQVAFNTTKFPQTSFPQTSFPQTSFPQTKFPVSISQESVDSNTAESATSILSVCNTPEAHKCPNFYNKYCNFTTAAPTSGPIPHTTTGAPFTTTAPPRTTTVAPVTTAAPFTTTAPPRTTTVAPVTTAAPFTTTVPPRTTTVAPSYSQKKLVEICNRSNCSSLDTICGRNITTAVPGPPPETTYKFKDIKYLGDITDPNVNNRAAMINKINHNIDQCMIYYTDLGIDNSKYSSKQNLTAKNIGNIWNKATDGLDAYGGGQTYTDRAITQALGECQAYIAEDDTSKYRGMISDIDHGGCDNTVSGSGTSGGIFQLSSYNSIGKNSPSDKIPDDISTCNTDTNVFTNPCCNALATLYHRRSCKQDWNVPDCQIISQTKINNDNEYINAVEKSSGHNMCLNGPFCNKADDKEWNNNTLSPNEPTAKGCCAWNDSWNKYSNSRGVSATTGIKMDNGDTYWSALNAGKHDQWNKIKYAINQKDVGLLPTYYDVAFAATKELNGPSWTSA